MTTPLEQLKTIESNLYKLTTNDVGFVQNEEGMLMLMVFDTERQVWEPLSSIAGIGRTVNILVKENLLLAKRVRHLTNKFVSFRDDVVCLAEKHAQEDTK